MNDEDALLIGEALAGNTPSFGQLVRKYQDRLFNTIVHIVGSSDEARDVVQDAFVQAFVKLDSFQGTAGFYTWLYRIAFNAAISRRRRMRPAVSVERNREQTGHEPIDLNPGPDEQLEQRERVQQIRAAMSALSEDHRTILVLREIESFDYDTISTILELPVGTVRSRLHRARLELREMLKQVLQEDVAG